MSEPDLAGFVGAQPFAPPLTRRPERFTIVPAPRRCHMHGAVDVDATAVALTGAPPGARDVLLAGLARAGVATVGGGGWPVVFASDPAVIGDEAYVIESEPAGMRIRAATAT